MGATMKDIAQETGLGLATISSYLNGGNVREKNRIKIEEAIEKLHFEVNEVARGLKTNRTKTIGIILPELNNIFFSEIITAAEDLLRSHGYATMICDCRSDVKREEEAAEFLLHRRVDGLIMMPTGAEKKVFDRFRKSGRPVVLIDRRMENGDCDCVLVDNEGAAQNAVKRLMQKGHKKIGMITGPDNVYTARERQRGYELAIQESSKARSAQQSDLKGKTDKSMGNYKGFATAENTILRYIGTDKNPIVPDGITAIGKRAFTYCDIDTVELPNSLTQIGEAAFYLSTLKDITIPKNVKKIEDDAFDWCPFLEKVTINGNAQIGSNAILVSDRLSENKIEVNNSDIKNRILSFGISEYELPAFYELINSNRELIGWNKVEEVEPTATPESTTKPTATVPTATVPPTTVPTKEPTATVKPSETTAPAAKLKKLTVETGNVVTVKVDSTDVVFPDAQPFVDENGRTQVPIRAVSEMLDCKVDWDDTSKTATITKENGDVVKVTLGSDVLTVNNKSSQMDTTAIIKDDRTFIPVRFVAEALGLEVEWLE